MRYFVYIFLFTIMGYAQEKQSEVLKVTTTVENYFYGYIERDAVKLNKAFDLDNGTMKIPVKETSSLTGYKNGYFKEIIPKWANRVKLSESELKDCNLTISTITIESNQMAIVKMKMNVGEKTYIDILSLQKIEDQWKITNKMYITL